MVEREQREQREQRELRELRESDRRRQNDVCVTSVGARVGWCPEPLKYERSDQIKQIYRVQRARGFITSTECRE